MESMPTTGTEIFDLPTAAEIDALAVGDMAIDCWGRLSRVVEISYRGTDIKGRRFVGYTTDFGAGSTISMSRKEGKLTRTVALSNRFLSRELDDIERRLLAERAGQ